MANREVNLTKRVQTPHGWRYCTVVLSANGRVKPDLVLVNGKQEAHKEGAYYLEWREGSKRVRLSVGKDPADASARRQRKEAELNAVNNGVSVVPDGQNGHRSIAAAVAEFLDETKLTKKPKTLAAYSTALAYFVESCHKLNLEEIDRKDLLKFSAFLRDEKDTGTAQCLQQIRECDDISQGKRNSWLGGQERLAAVHRRGAGDLRAGRTRQAFRRSVTQKNGSGMNSS